MTSGGPASSVLSAREPGLDPMNDVVVGAFRSARRKWRASMSATARASVGFRYASAALPLAVTRRVTSPWSPLTTWIMVFWSAGASALVGLPAVTHRPTQPRRVLL